MHAPDNRVLPFYEATLHLLLLMLLLLLLLCMDLTKALDLNESLAEPGLWKVTKDIYFPSLIKVQCFVQSIPEKSLRGKEEFK